MKLGAIIREIGRGHDGARHLDADQASELFGEILAGSVPDLELGAILLALRTKGESAEEMLAFLDAASRHVRPLQSPAGRPRPVVLPSFNGARREANLTPLLALLLQHHGIPVIVHCHAAEGERVGSAAIFCELGILPCANIEQAQESLVAGGLALVAPDIVVPELARLLALRDRLGVRNCAHSLVKMIDPFSGEGVLVAAATHPAFLDLTRELLLFRKGRALLLRATEGEPYANPKRRPRIEWLHDGKCAPLFEADTGSLLTLPRLPEDRGAAATAAWTSQVVNGRVPLPGPIADQLAACLVACGALTGLAEARRMIAAEWNFRSPD